MSEHQRSCDNDALSALLREELPAAESESVIAHLENCGDCQQHLRDLVAPEAEWRHATALISSCSRNDGSEHSCSIPKLETQTTTWTESMAKQLLSPPTHPEMLGRLGRYEVERLIGAGGMGVVFKAFDTELNRPVAIKLLAPYLASSGPARQRFSHEKPAQQLQSFIHMLFPFTMSRPSVNRRLSSCSMSQANRCRPALIAMGHSSCARSCGSACRSPMALSAAHQQGLVHRDIKPSNILLEEDVDRTLISDFGLARAADDASLTCSGFHPGTPQYMSPEQASGQSVDARSDLFSLGSTLYTMCTGRPPFRAESSYDVMRKISDEVATPIRELNPDIPEWLALIIEKLMAKVKSERFHSSTEVRELLEACLSHVQQPAVFKLPAQLSTRIHSARQSHTISSRRLLYIGLFSMLSILSAIALSSFFLQIPSESIVQQEEADTVVLGHGYSRIGKFIYFDGQRIEQVSKDDFKKFSAFTDLELTQCEDVDAASFKALSEEYSKDKNNVYYKWTSPGRYWVTALPLADVSSFEVIGFNLAKDDKQVWWYGKPLQGVDPKTVELVKEGFVWKDATSVWYQQTELSGADAKTFQHLGQAFYRDANRVYWSTTLLEGADPDTFRTFGDDCSYGADRNSVWNGETKITGYDAATFQPIHQSICKDKNGVYAGGYLIDNADPKSFRKIADLDASYSALLTDVQHHYLFLPLYGDVYRISSTAVSLNVEHSIWPPGMKQKGTFRGDPVAIATAELGVTGWGKLSIAADTAIDSTQLQKRESYLLNLFTAQFTKAWEIIRERKSQVNSVEPLVNVELVGPDDHPEKSKPASEGWRSDIVAFDTYLGEFVGKWRIPDEPSLAKRVAVLPGGEETNSEVLPVTDGAGGYVDLAPAEDTVQFQVNKALKGQPVKWEFELAHDVAISISGVAQLIPKATTKENAKPFLATLFINTTEELDFKAGDLVKLEATIGDASSIIGIGGLQAPTGPVAVYHLASTPHPIFWLGLTNVTISGPTRKIAARLEPAPEVTEVAKDLLRACMIYDEQKLNAVYASEVQLLPGNRLFYFGLEYSGKMTEYGVPVMRNEMLVALKKQTAKDPIPSLVVDSIVNSFRIEQLDIAAGNYATEPNQPGEALYRSLRFKINENDVLLRLSVPGVFRFVQLRKTDNQWKVIAEY
jgi:serine/threonine protein kinase